MVEDMTAITDHEQARRILADPRYLVPEADASTSPFGRFRAEVSRFANGPTHDVRRRGIESILGGVDLGRLARTAGAITTRMNADGTADLTAIARHVPVVALAHELGFAVGEELPELVAVVAEAYQSGDGSDAADAAILRLLGAARGADTLPGDAALRVQLLVQAYAATAGLIETAARRRIDADPSTSPVPAEELIAEVLLDEPPVRTTKRVGPDGALLTVHLDGGGRAENASRVEQSLAFGAGPRACPAPQHAIAIAVAVVDELGFRA